MKRLRLYTAAVLLVFFTAVSFADTARIHNFPVYNVLSQRMTLFSILEKLPKNGSLVINFTSIHCEPCRKEVPELVELSRDQGNTAVLFIYAEYNKAEVREYASALIKDDKIMPMVCTDLFGTIQKEFGVKSVPCTLVVDRQGRIRGRFEGYTPGNMEKIKHLTGE